MIKERFSYNPIKHAVIIFEILQMLSSQHGEKNIDD